MLCVLCFLFYVGGEALHAHLSRPSGCVVICPCFGLTAPGSGHNNYITTIIERTNILWNQNATANIVKLQTFIC